MPLYHLKGHVGVIKIKLISECDRTSVGCGLQAAAGQLLAQRQHA